MKVEDLREKEHTLEFSDLAVGDVFKKAVFDGTDSTYMKIPNVVEASKKDDYEYEYDDNAVCFEDGDLVWIDWDERVIKVEVKLVIEK